MICRFYDSAPGIQVGANAEIELNMTYPVEFYDWNVSFSGSAIPQASLDFVFHGSYSVDKTKGSIAIHNGATVQYFRRNYIAIGRWKD